MGSEKNLVSKPAVSKIKELAEDEKMCMFCTNLGKGPVSTRPMATQEVDKDGYIWFFSQAGSDKNREIEDDPRVQLIYSNRSSSEYMTVSGTAEILRDREKARDLWNVFLTTWFNEGVDDPSLTLIRVKPEEGHYWDAKHNKMVQSVKIAIGAIRGKMMDDGVEGDLRP